MDYKIDIICPLYNAEKYIENLQKSLEKQGYYEKIKNIRYIITESKDNTEKLVSQMTNKKILYKIIKKEDFSHSLTREKEVMESSADIIVFISQDVKIEKENWLEKLVNPIIENIVEASFSRQICTDKNSLEYYTRKKNYPNESIIKTKECIEKLGIKAFFYSDAASAIRRDIFIRLNGYDGKILPTNEDMYMAYKLLKNDYKIKYCADSGVVHSHNFTCKETYDRYKAYGKFLKLEPEVDIKSKNAGGSLAIFMLKEIIKDKNIKLFFKFFVDMGARFIGLKVGKHNG